MARAFQSFENNKSRIYSNRIGSESISIMEIQKSELHAMTKQNKIHNKRRLHNNGTRYYFNSQQIFTTLRHHIKYRKLRIK